MDQEKQEITAKDPGEIRVPRRKRTLLPSRRRPESVRVKTGIDHPFLILVIILLCIGTTFVFSSSYVYAKNRYGDSYFFARSQLIWAGLSLVVMFVVSNVSFRLYKRFALPLFLVSYVLLWLVFFFGADANGARRWIYVGPVSMQPSEIVKFTVVILISKYISGIYEKNRDLMRTFRYGILPFGIVVLLVGVPLFFQPHLSAMVIIFALIFILMYLGGVKPAFLGTLLGVGSAGMLGVILFTSHGRSRLANWINPELDPLGDGWQPLQSLYAIGSGGFWGLGLGQSKQKHLYLPEPQNDYIFAIVCEEMGWIFAVAVIVLFVLLLWRGLHIARNAPDQFSSLVATGIIIQIALQVFLNIGVVTNSLPSTGVSLPFFSYGGSSLIIFMAEMGVILNISKQSSIEKT